MRRLWCNVYRRRKWNELGDPSLKLIPLGKGMNPTILPSAIDK